MYRNFKTRKRSANLRKSGFTKRHGLFFSDGNLGAPREGRVRLRQALLELARPRARGPELSRESVLVRLRLGEVRGEGLGVLDGLGRRFNLCQTLLRHHPNAEISAHWIWEFMGIERPNLHFKMSFNTCSDVG